MADSVHKRHDLVWLTRNGWDALLASCPEHESVLGFWRSEDWPAAVRPRDPDSDPALEVCAGIALPPGADGIPRGIAFRVPLEHIQRSSAPLLLKAARPALLPQWRPGCTVLQDLAVGLDLRVTGPVAWQAITSLPMIEGGAGIDIQFRPLTRHQLKAGLALLAGPAHGLPLEGEVMFPSGEAVSWKEWARASAARAQVLAKGLDGARMAGQDELLASLRPD